MRITKFRKSGAYELHSADLSTDLRPWHLKVTSNPRRLLATVVNVAGHQALLTMAEEQQISQLDAYPREFREQLAIRELDENGKPFETFEDMPGTNMDLRMALEDCEKAINKFFSTYLENAMDIMKVWNTTMYHTLGASVVEFIPPQHSYTANTLAVLKNMLTLCQQYHDSSALDDDHDDLVFKMNNFVSMTDVEAQAQLCQDCCNSLKYCVTFLKKTWVSQESLLRFNNGIRLAFAGIHIITTVLLPRLVIAFESLGLSHLTDSRLAELQACIRHPNYRTLLCQSMSLICRQATRYFIGSISVIDLCQRIMEIRPLSVRVFHETEICMLHQYVRARIAEDKLYRIATTLQTFRELYQRYDVQLEMTTNTLNHWLRGVQRLYRISKICNSRHARALESLNLMKELHDGCCREIKWENRSAVPNEPTYLRLLSFLRTLQQNNFRCFNELLSARSVMLSLRSMTTQLHERCIYTSEHCRSSSHVLRLWRNINFRFSEDVAWGNDATTYVDLAIELDRENHACAAFRYVRVLRNIRFLKKLHEFGSAERVVTIGLIIDARGALDELHEQCVFAITDYNRTLSNIRQWKQLYYCFEMEFDFRRKMDAGAFYPTLYSDYHTRVYLLELGKLCLLRKRNRSLYMHVMWSDIFVIQWQQAEHLLRSCYSLRPRNNQATAVLQQWRLHHRFCYDDFLGAHATPSNLRKSDLYRVRCDFVATSYFRALNSWRLLRQLSLSYSSELTWANTMRNQYTAGYSTLAATYFGQAMTTLRVLQQLHQLSHNEIMWANAMAIDWGNVERAQSPCAVSAIHHGRAVAIHHLWKQIHHHCYTELTSANEKRFFTTNGPRHPPPNLPGPSYSWLRQI
ncbi:unnamed protein product [Parnassius apollo]|uniref:(apollo) hypothetical protein n=1 Tax=Parnassius apollo TaxID=110799 RepID=A0A8S3X7I1_PARAO|nr:unnamed protein product [Parnassius apollo]